MTRSILLIPSIRKKGGLGHLVRMMRLALSCKGNATLFLEPGGPTHWTEEEVRSFFPLFPWDSYLERNPESRPWEWVVLDRRSTSLEEYRRLHFGAPTLGLDEGGEARGVCSYLVDTFPRMQKLAEPNRTLPHFVPMTDISSPERGIMPTRKAFPNRERDFLLAFGGEDPFHLSEVAFDALVAAGVPAGDIDVLIGPARQYSFEKPCGQILPGGWEAKNYFSRYRWVITSFGLTPYEAILEGATPLLVNPTKYHDRLSEMAGFYTLGVRKVSQRRLRFALEHPDAVLPCWVQSQTRTPAQPQAQTSGISSWPALDETGVSFAEFVASLKADIPPKCPMCGTQDHRATFRFSDRTFFQCVRCNTEYRMYFGEQKQRYTAQYFLQEYRDQYGKTYLEDFPQIKAQGKKRLDFLKACMSHLDEILKGKSILDVGCALGPFLDAARDEGMVPYGIDLSEEAIQYVREKLGIPARVADIESFDPLGAFGIPFFHVVSLWYVIEHLPRVGQVLGKVRTLLCKDGWLIFSTPNGRGISSLRSPRSFREKSPIDHVTIWNIAQAKRVLLQYGFQVRAVRTPSHHPERFPSLVRTLLGVRGCKALETQFHLGDTFEVYAQKIDHDSGSRASSAPCH